MNASEEEIQEEVATVVDEGERGRQAGEGLPLEAQEEVEEVEPEVAVRSRPFAKKVSELETHVDELTDQFLIRMAIAEDNLEKLEERVGRYVTTLADVRKELMNSDNTAIRSEFKRLRDMVFQHIQQGTN